MGLVEEGRYLFSSAIDLNALGHNQVSGCNFWNTLIKPGPDLKTREKICGFLKLFDKDGDDKIQGKELDALNQCWYDRSLSNRKDIPPELIAAVIDAFMKGDGAITLVIQLVENHNTPKETLIKLNNFLKKADRYSGSSHRGLGRELRNKIKVALNEAVLKNKELA